MIPQSYDAWVQCITVDCKIELTAPYIRKRLDALRDRTDSSTKRYVTLYGEGYLEQVIGWFEQALTEHAED